MIRIRDLRKKFPARKGQPDRKELFGGLSVELPSEGVCAILGPSGCGKSTLLRLLGKLDSFEGAIEIPDGLPAYVFQEPRLLHWLNTRENITLPLELQGRADGVMKLDSLLTLVRLEKAGHLFPSELSGGMKMRAALARALIQNPRLLLMDEPLAALDEWTRHQLQEELVQFLRAGQLPSMILVTHSIEEAVFLADRAIILDHDGRLFHRAEFPPVKNRVPEDRFRPEFLEHCRALSAKLKEVHGGEARA